MNVPFVDLRIQYEQLKADIDAAIAAVIADTAFVGGRDNRYTRAFDEAFATWLGVGEFVGCANGTDSLELLLAGAGVGAGDEVIVPALSWISTSEAVTTVGATPVFVDIDPVTFTIDVTKLAEAVTSRTRAIIPVHLYGQPADMSAVMDFAGRHGLFVLEDCAQAHGALFQGTKVGTIGHASSFSFYPGKNLGAYGDAGGFTAKDPIVLEKARMLANHGQPKKHQHRYEGRNSRLDGIQAAILTAKLPHLDRWNEARRRIAARYDAALAPLAGRVDIPRVGLDRSHVYHLYVVRTADRAALADHLRSLGIANAVHYPTPLPLLEAYARFGFTAADFPAAAKACAEILSLPVFPEMDAAQSDAVVDAVHAYAARIPAAA